MNVNFGNSNAAYYYAYDINDGEEYQIIEELTGYEKCDSISDFSKKLKDDLKKKRSKSCTDK